MRPFSRRRFLRVLAALSVAAAMPTQLLAAVDRRVAPQSFALSQLADSPAVGGLDGVNAVASVYLHQHPEEASTAMLREALGFGPRKVATKNTKKLAPRITADFEADDIVALDGWRLSRTEARWAALVHLERLEAG